jgi:hypothetical protein
LIAKVFSINQRILAKIVAMKFLLTLSMVLFLFSCTDQKTTEPAQGKNGLAGTWKLFEGTIIEKGDTTVTDYTKERSFIKIINDTHFSFTLHDLAKGKDSATAAFSAGAGSYSLEGNHYTEHLEYCSAREWEGHDFHFTISISNDTLVQTGEEIIESEGISRLNTEKYVRVK